jgi:hypothetical protein
MTFVNFQLNSQIIKEQTSLPLKDLFRNSWKYHFDSVLSRFHLLIDVISNLVQINNFFWSFIILFFITITIVKPFFLFAMRIMLSALGVERFQFEL